jgi:hypothetical protein
MLNFAALSADPHALAALDDLLASNTGFPTFQALLDAKGSYRPTVDVSTPEMAFLADAYDAAMTARGDARRAYRTGNRVAALVERTAFVPAAALVPGEEIEVEANQGMRPAVVLAVLGQRALAEYTMPAGTTALMVLDLGKSARMFTQAATSPSYRTCPRKWLVAMVAAGTQWEGNGQQGGALSFAKALELAGVSSTPAQKELF